MNEPSILIVDEELESLAQLSDFFQTNRFDVVTATDPHVGLQHLTQQRFEVVLSDQSMRRDSTHSGMSHGFGSELGPETGLLVQIIKEFIAKKVS